MVFYPAGFHNSYPRYVKYPLENIEFLRMANFNIAGGRQREREREEALPIFGFYFSLPHAHIQRSNFSLNVWYKRYGNS